MQTNYQWGRLRIAFSASHLPQVATNRTQWKDGLGNSSGFAPAASYFFAVVLRLRLVASAGGFSRGTGMFSTFRVDSVASAWRFGCPLAAHRW